MKSWVQAVCENQPLGVARARGGQGSQEAGRANQESLFHPADEICDYFGVKIAMYFAWLGFYTSAMVYPAVFGSVLYTFTEADQVPGVGWAGAGSSETPSSLVWLSQQLSPPLPPPDKPGCILCGLCPVQRGLVDTILGGVETEGCGASLQVGDPGLTWGSCGRATTPVQGKLGVLIPRTLTMWGRSREHCRNKDRTCEIKLQHQKGCAK